MIDGQAMSSNQQRKPLEIGAFLQGISTTLFFVFFRALLPLEEQASLHIKQPLHENIGEDEPKSSEV